MFPLSRPYTKGLHTKQAGLHTGWGMIPLVYGLDGKKLSERPSFGGVFTRGKNGAPSRKGCVANGQMTNASKT